jgi:hypothetical protein
MVGLACCVFDGREKVLSLQEGIISEDFADGGASGKQFEHIRHANAVAEDAGSFDEMLGRGEWNARPVPLQ